MGGELYTLLGIQVSWVSGLVFTSPYKVEGYLELRFEELSTLPCY